MVLNNAKHEKFCQVWHETNNKSQAFRESHPNSLKWKDETVHNKASALSKQGEISARFSELQQESLKGHNITIESLLKELDESRKIALSAETPQCSAANAATMSKAKLVGLDRQVIEHTHKVVDDGSNEW
jgi:hypothetical protein